MKTKIENLVTSREDRSVFLLCDAAVGIDQSFLTRRSGCCCFIVQFHLTHSYFVLYHSLFSLPKLSSLSCDASTASLHCYGAVFGDDPLALDVGYNRKSISGSGRRGLLLHVVVCGTLDGEKR